MPSQTQSLSRLLKKESFVYVPEAYDALGARPVEKTGFKAAD
jgi:2-methylisocitrate lyase-like PEP mutase family enzyme